jgi:hypothetical protein
MKLGATGDYPIGKLSDDDEGGLMMGITVEDKRLIINFGKSLTWIGMDKETAQNLAFLILARCEDM